MILPTKHTTTEQSLLGFGSYLLQTIGDGATVDDLWSQYQKDFAAKAYHYKQSFDNLLLTLIFLFSVNAIYENNGEIKRCA
jgi:hypothetical protein